jgi:hypothetical protein
MRQAGDAVGEQTEGRLAILSDRSPDRKNACFIISAVSLKSDQGPGRMIFLFA